MIDGAMEHRDTVGNRGRLTGGSVQWMTAGSGIIHSEMPQQERGLLWGFQLWVNLPRKLKMMRPRYQDIARDRVPVVGTTGPTRVLAGELGGETGPVADIVVAPTMLDVTIPAGSSFEHALPDTHNAFAYVLTGDTLMGSDQRHVASRELAVLGQGATFVASAPSGDVRLLLVAGEPIGEPVARRGPFVMNTEAELEQAFADYRAGRLVDG
jgi:redox-sensitive bicupin YhaK (pirin superfamily)